MEDLFVFTIYIFIIVINAGHLTPDKFSEVIRSILSIVIPAKAGMTS